MRDPQGQRSHLLEINASIVAGQLSLEWTYSDNLHHHSTIERLASFYVEALRSLIAHCSSPTAGGYTPSDFPEAHLSQPPSMPLFIHSLRELRDWKSLSLARPNLEAIYPLSPLQEGMLFHHLYAPQSEVYFEQVTCTLHGTMDVTAFKQAWLQVIAHQPTLRTLFLWEHLDTPLQVVRQQVDVPWTELDWCSLPSDEQDTQVQAKLRADRAQGFDLSQAPLLRLHLIRLSEQVTHFTWSFHHLLLDGWSASAVLGQVFACYEAARQGHTLSLPTGRPYRDYIYWLQQQDLAQAETFWRETLRGFTAPTSLHVALAAPAKTAPKPDYADFVLRIPATTTAALQTLARQQQLTLNTLTQGAWALLLSRYSGEPDVVFGVTVAGRPATLAGVESMVGMFLNTLPLRARVEPQLRILPWLQSLQAQAAEARQYEYTPLVQIQTWSELRQHPGTDQQSRGQSLFETLFIFENYPVDASLEQNSSLAIAHAHVTEWTNYPLTVEVIPDTNLLVRFSYMSGHFDAATIQRLATHFQTILEGLVDNPTQRLDAVPFLAASERQQMLVEWNATETAYSLNQSIPALFEQQVAQTPDAIAGIYADSALTYGELNRRANALAHFLRTYGVGRGTLVAVCLNRSLDMLVSLLAILKAGAAYVPLDPLYPGERLTFMLDDSHASILLTTQPLLAGLPATSVYTVTLDTVWSEIAPGSENNPSSGVSGEDMAYVIYTSGSTGQPKGVIGTHRATLNRMYWMWDHFPFKEGELCCQKTSLSFVDSIWEIFGPLLRGIGSVILPDEIVKDPYHLIATLAEQHVTRIVLVPSLLRMLLDTSFDLAIHLACVLYWFSSGETLPAELAESFLNRVPHGVLLNLYGSSEVAADATCAPATTNCGLSSVSLGRPIANTQLYLLDAQLQPVPTGVPGEIYIGGAGLARGYLNRPELTAERFIPDLFGVKPGARLYRTGDRGRYLPNGEIEFLGRLDYQVKLRGYRIELGEIEAALAEHPIVRASVVVLREAITGDKRLVAYVVLNEDEQVPVTQKSASIVANLRTFLRGRLPEYMLPTSVVLLPALPLTPNGKLDRSNLPVPEQAAPPLTTIDVETRPRTPVEEVLTDIWASVLSRERVGIFHNFFELGGHSLLATQVISRVRHVFHVDIPLQCLFAAPTVAHFAETLIQNESLPGQITATAQVRLKLKNMSAGEVQMLLSQARKTRGV